VLVSPVDDDVGNISWNKSLQVGDFAVCEEFNIQKGVIELATNRMV